MPDAVGELAREAERLVNRMRVWSPSTWRAPASGGRSRAEWAVLLCGDLVELGRRAGTGVPAGVVPPRLADYALADQVAVLTEDLIVTLGDSMMRSEDWEEVAGEVRAVVCAARVNLEAQRPFGFHP